MIRPILLLLTSAILLAACGPTVTTTPSGNSVYRLNNAMQGQVQLRMLDSVNALRSAKGLTAVQLSSALNAAAETHSRDMARQNRPWHFGSDGSSPVARVVRAGYQKGLLGENISESFETETQTLAAWMQQPDTANVVLNPAAEDLGIAFYQQDNGKIWWTMVMGGGGAAQPYAPVPMANTAPPAS